MPIRYSNKTFALPLWSFGSNSIFMFHFQITLPA
jgi:hypothetical protein